MKKLTILFVLVFLAVGLFASPKIPKTQYLSEDYYKYVSNSGSNLYTTRYIVDNSFSKYGFVIKNKSLVTKVEISITLYFPNESALNDYSRLFIDENNLEETFSFTKDSLDDAGLEPMITLDENDNVSKFIYVANYN